MSDDAGATPDQAPAGATPDTSTGGTPEGDDKPDSLEGLREALAKEREARRRFEAEAKKNAGAAKRLADAEEADKSELQKANDAKALAEASAAKAEGRLLRLEIAAAKGLSLAMAGRLAGETKEEIEADADELLKELRPASKPDTTGRPRESLRSGTAPDTQPEETDPVKLAALVPRT